MIQGDPVKILIVDDLPQKILVYQSILEEPGLEIVSASSGADALRQVLSSDFAVILLDVEMPGIDGFEAASLIRARKRSAYTPIIFVTAHADELHALRGYASGGVDYILTPVVPEILRTKVRVFVDLFRLSRQVRQQAEWQVARAHGEQVRLATVLENAADFVGQTDPQGRLLHINRAGRRMIGWGESEPLPPDMFSILSPPAAELIERQGLPSALRDGVWFGESAILNRDGQPVPVSQVILAHKSAAGNVESISFIASDISERKRAEAAMRESERRYRQLVHCMPAAVYTCDAQGRVTLYNQAAAVLWGREPEIGRDLWCGSRRLRRPDGTDLPMSECPMAIALREGRPVRDVEIVIERPDGSCRHVLPHAEPTLDDAGNIVGAVNMLIDVTERKQAEEARLLLAAIVDSTDDAVISMTLDGVVTSFNRAAERLYGYSATEIIGQSVTLLVPPDRREEELAMLGRIRGGVRVEHMETVRVSRGGRRMDVFLTVSPVQDASGRITGASKIARDITERKRAELLLHESESRLRAMFGQAAVGIALLEPGGRLLEVNGRLSQILGRSPEELGELSCRALLHPDESAGSLAMLEEVSSGARSELAMEARYLRGDGTWVWVNVTVSPLLDEQERVHRLMLVVEDIDARKHAEQELRQHREHLEHLVRERTAELQSTHEQLRLADRLASIGTLAAGLGHDMGNLLLPLRMQLESLEGRDLPDGARHEVTGIRTVAEYLQRLSDGLRLLVLDSGRDARSGVVEVRDWWKSAFPILRNAAPEPVEICESLPATACWIGMAPTALTQVAFNLVQNAANAMKARRSGRISVEVAMDGDHVRVSVVDDGPGMSEDVRQRCMEPFFTTRSRGVSTGLGLFIVYGLIKQAGGRIDVRSELGRGTTFVVSLPAVGPPAAAAPGIRGVASIDVRDERLRAMVIAELDRFNFEVQADGERRRSAILVTDATEEIRLQRLVDEDPQRTVVLLGSAPGVDDARVISCGPAPRTSEIRAMIKRVVGLKSTTQSQAGEPRSGTG